MSHISDVETIYTPFNAKIADLKQSAINEISPMELDVSPIDRKTAEKSENLCIRCIRKKFICLVVFFLALISIANILNTFIGKLSENDVSAMYNYLKSYVLINNKTIVNTTFFE